MPNYMVQACICSYMSIDTDDIKLLTKNYSECCCFTHYCCLAVEDKGYGLEFVTSGSDICKLNLVLCGVGFKKPTSCIKTVNHTLCIKTGHALPFDNETVTRPLCAICGCQLAPEVEFAAKAPSLPSMVR